LPCCPSSATASSLTDEGQTPLAAVRRGHVAYRMPAERRVQDQGQRQRHVCQRVRGAPRVPARGGGQPTSAASSRRWTAFGAGARAESGRPAPGDRLVLDRSPVAGGEQQYFPVLLIGHGIIAVPTVMLLTDRQAVVWCRPRRLTSAAGPDRRASALRGSPWHFSARSPAACWRRFRKDLGAVL